MTEVKNLKAELREAIGDEFNTYSYEQTIEEFLDKAYALGQQSRQQQEWVSVKERLPEFDGYYLCYLKRNNECGTISTIVDVRRNMFNTWQLFHGEEVTHWQPLPHPPQKGE